MFRLEHAHSFPLIVFVEIKTKPNTSVLAVVPNFQTLTLIPFALDFLMCINFLLVCPWSIGFILYPVISISDHVNSISRSCFYYLRKLRSIRPSLLLHAITILVHALNCARVDYDYASKLQAVLNAAVRLPKFSHISSRLLSSGVTRGHGRAAAPGHSPRRGCKKGKFGINIA